MPNSIYRIRRDDHDQLTEFVWLHNDFPCLSRVPSLDDEPSFKDIGTMTARVLEHET